VPAADAFPRFARIRPAGSKPIPVRPDLLDGQGEAGLQSEAEPVAGAEGLLAELGRQAGKPATARSKRMFRG